MNRNLSTPASALILATVITGFNASKKESRVDVTDFLLQHSAADLRLAFTEESDDDIAMEWFDALYPEQWGNGRVNLTDLEVAKFFGVRNIADITQDMIRHARHIRRARLH
ncbi:hypothetical protein [Paraburkholderia sp. J8-2]|uniref:hypothetical protein n=1 Tax=Paraburkholderia sp. J8-2 TaxID=2805440 RepID=UPI002AB769C7|nr:hypothetical protein [Paraburkholderia sp. J8-2]